MAIDVADELKKVYRSLRYRAFKLQEDSGYIDEDEIKDLVTGTDEVNQSFSNGIAGEHWIARDMVWND